jgi:hypothetical protein
MGVLLYLGVQSLNQAIALLNQLPQALPPIALCFPISDRFTHADMPYFLAAELGQS